jgi:hypothetical protein
VRPGFDHRRKQRIFPLASVFRPALRPTQPPIQQIPGFLSQGVKHGRGVTLTTHLHLGARSRMSRSYISSPPCRLHGGGRKDLLFYLVALLVLTQNRSQITSRNIHLFATDHLNFTHTTFNNIHQESSWHTGETEKFKEKRPLRIPSRRITLNWILNRV